MPVREESVSQMKDTCYIYFKLVKICLSALRGQQPPERRPSTENEKGALLWMP